MQKPKKIIIPQSAYKVNNGQAHVPVPANWSPQTQYNSPYIDLSATYLFNLDSKKEINELTFAPAFFSLQFPQPITIRFIPTKKIKSINIVQNHPEINLIRYAAFNGKKSKTLADVLNFKTIEFDGFDTDLKLSFVTSINQTSLILQAKSIDLSISDEINNKIEKIWLNSWNIKLRLENCFHLKEINFDTVEHLDARNLKFKSINRECVLSFPKNIKIDTDLIRELTKIDLFQSLDMDDYLKTVFGFMPTWINLEEEVTKIFPETIKDDRIILTYKQYRKIVKNYAYKWLQKLIDNKNINEMI